MLQQGKDRQQRQRDEKQQGGTGHKGNQFFDILTHLLRAKADTATLAAATKDKQKGYQSDGEDSDTQSFTITVESDLDIEKVAEDLNGAPLRIGDLIRYEITITNDVVAMTGVVVTDTLPDGVAFVSAEPSGGTIVPNSLVWTVGELGAGATWTAVITVEVDGSANPIGGNVAAVSSDQQAVQETDQILPPGGGDVDFWLYLPLVLRAHPLAP